MTEGIITLSAEDIRNAVSNGIKDYLYTQEQMGGLKLERVVSDAIEQRVCNVVTEDLIREEIAKFFADNKEEILKSMTQQVSPKRGRPAKPDTPSGP